VIKRKPGLLKEVDIVRTGSWVASLGEQHGKGLTPDELKFLEPDGAFLREFVDEDLAELTSRGTNTKLGQLAASEMRRREAWRTPARWTLVVSAVALVISIVSLAVALLAK